MNSHYPPENASFGPESDSLSLKKNVAEEKTITPALLAALRDGDHEAFKTVYIHYSSSLRRFLAVLTRSENEAEEITQDVFVRLWEKRAGIDPGKNVRTYLYTMAKNQLMNRFEHGKVKQRFEKLHTGREEMNPASDEILIAQETEILIELAVSRMPKQRRKVFELSRLEGMSNEMIAKELNLSKETVAAHLSYARKDIKEVIALLLLFLGGFGVS